MGTHIEWIDATEARAHVEVLTEADDIRDEHGQGLDRGRVGLSVGPEVVIEGSPAEVIGLLASRAPRPSRSARRSRCARAGAHEPHDWTGRGRGRGGYDGETFRCWGRPADCAPAVRTGGDDRSAALLLPLEPRASEAARGSHEEAQAEGARGRGPAVMGEKLDEASPAGHEGSGR